VLDKAVGAPVMTGYGLTETGVVTLSTPDANKPGSVDVPSAWTWPLPILKEIIAAREWRPR
jgi:hypothetical protein